MSTITVPTLIQGGLVWLATQTWADTAKVIIDEHYPYGRKSIRAHMLYAIVVTILIIIVVWLISRWSNVQIIGQIEKKFAKPTQVIHYLK